MKIQPINSNFYIQKKQQKKCSANPTFGTFLKVLPEAREAICYADRSKFDSVMESFASLISKRFPLTQTLVVKASNSQYAKQYCKGTRSDIISVPHNPYVNIYASSESKFVQVPVYEKENIQLKLGESGCGFLFNATDSKEQILQDLDYAFKCIRAHSGFMPGGSEGTFM